MENAKALAARAAVAAIIHGPASGEAIAATERVRAARVVARVSKIIG